MKKIVLLYMELLITTAISFNLSMPRILYELFFYRRNILRRYTLCVVKGDAFHLVRVNRRGIP